eukprot:4984732-Pleurochrysis_carterae.AAC.1
MSRCLPIGSVLKPSRHFESRAPTHLRATYLLTCIRTGLRSPFLSRLRAMLPPHRVRIQSRAPPTDRACVQAEDVALQNIQARSRMVLSYLLAQAGAEVARARDGECGGASQRVAWRWLGSRLWIGWMRVYVCEVAGVGAGWRAGAGAGAGVGAGAGGSVESGGPAPSSRGVAPGARVRVGIGVVELALSNALRGEASRTVPGGGGGDAVHMMGHRPNLRRAGTGRRRRTFRWGRGGRGCLGIEGGG